MGARREYVASFTHYHETNDNLYYSAGQTTRLFPVPKPMLPERKQGLRRFDIAIAADFYELTDEAAYLITQEIAQNKQLNLTTALIQMNKYTLKRHENKFHPNIRELIDGEHVQRVVYGEELACKLLIVRTPLILQERQKYLPKINTIATLIMIDELPVLEYNGKKVTNYNVRQCLRHLMIYTNKRGRWYPLNEQMRQLIEKRFSHDFRFIKLSTENWVKTREQHDEHYAIRIEDWLIDE